MERSIVN